MQRKFSLYIVATPIGNLDDITFRAVECLNTVDFILCEDTRNSVKLLNHFKIKKHLFAYHKFNEKEVVDGIIQRLLSGETAALISDAGTPLLSDPGCVLTEKLIENNIDFCVLPGANALLPSIIMSGFPFNAFTFAGFLPKKAAERYKKLEAYLKSDIPVVFYASPHKLKKVLSDIERITPLRRMAVSKEITKLYEHTYRGTASEIIALLPEEIKGEFTIVIDRTEPTDETLLTDENEIIDMFTALISNGCDRKTALAEICSRTSLTKKEVYALVMKKD